MYSVFVERYLKLKSLTLTVVGRFHTNRLLDEPELILIRVTVSLVVMEQVLTTLLTKQEVAAKNVAALIRF